MIGSQFQAALHAALTSANICSGRIYDRVPEGVTFPYVTIGDEQVIDDGNSCDDGWNLYADVHVWSRPDAGSKAEVKTLAAAVVTAVKGITSISEHTLIELQHDRSLFRRERDGMTEHAVITFRAIVGPA